MPARRLAAVAHHRSRAPPGGIAELDRVGPRTAVWRNEAHHYLLHPDHGEQIAAALRTLLAGTTRAPILVLGTIWPRPGYFDEFADHSPVGQARTRHAPQPLPAAPRTLTRTGRLATCWPDVL
ncbi:hypothetical protein QF030_000435 [Streptomyces rishiriensis]|uniref:Uncharacterized protein n=1 Tax=Streptomyces rishiriensis TaxID=68264 RepID=A0ABU0NGM0_STRRH|nr:hypothetical protein [Streptomyces rishiriensis]